MKKILFTALALVMTTHVMAQQLDTVYVVFTPEPETEDIQGIQQEIFYDDTDFYSTPGRFFTIHSRPANYFFMFIYENMKDEPIEYIRFEPASFLDTVEYIDWDEIGPTLTKEEAEELVAEILSYGKIYFIPRPVTTTPQPSLKGISGEQSLVPVANLELVPVTPLRSSY
jgi:hypothetical protein